MNVTNILAVGVDYRPAKNIPMQLRVLRQTARHAAFATPPNGPWDKIIFGQEVRMLPTTQGMSVPSLHVSLYSRNNIEFRERHINTRSVAMEHTEERCAFYVKGIAMGNQPSSAVEVHCLHCLTRTCMAVLIYNQFMTRNTLRADDVANYIDLNEAMDPFFKDCLRYMLYKFVDKHDTTGVTTMIGQTCRACGADFKKATTIRKTPEGYRSATCDAIVFT